MADVCDCLRCRHKKLSDDPPVGDSLDYDEKKFRLTSECVHISFCVEEIAKYIGKFSEGSIKLKKTDYTRVLFMRDTVVEIFEYYSKQSDDIKTDELFVLLTEYLVDLMMDIMFMLGKITKYEAVITQNFDIFEWKILEVFKIELETMFPLEGCIPKASELISDSNAREAWVSTFGSNCMVSYDNFIKMVGTKFLNPTSESYFKTLQKIEYIVNFPSRFVITPCKWNFLVKLFGPCDKLEENLGKFGKSGFLGYTNRIQSYEILKQGANIRLLFRFSRTEPGFFAFSYRNGKGEISHKINKDQQTGKPIPVREFLKSKFPQYTLVEESLNIDRILKLNRLENPLSVYASESSVYWSQIHPDFEDYANHENSNKF